MRISIGLLKNLTYQFKFPRWFFRFTSMGPHDYGEGQAKYWMKLTQQKHHEQDLKKQTPKFWQDAWKLARGRQQSIILHFWIQWIRTKFRLVYKRQMNPFIRVRINYNSSLKMDSARALGWLQWLRVWFLILLTSWSQGSETEPYFRLSTESVWDPLSPPSAQPLLLLQINK